MRFMKFLSAAGLLAATWFAAPMPASAADLVGHYLDYQVEFRNLPAGAKTDGTWQSSAVAICKMWKTSQLAALSISVGSKSVSLVIVQQSDEAADGLTGNYTVQATANGQKNDIRAGVTFPAKGQPGKMDLTSGGNTVTKAIPAGVLMQAAFLQSMLDQLSSGKTEFTLQSIEPLTDTGYEEVHVEVLPNSPFGATPLPADTSGALKGKVWFLKATHKSDGNTQDVMLQMHESGVVSRILANISGIQLEMTVRSVTVFPKPGC